MTQPLKPASVEVSSLMPPANPGMKLRRKLALIAIPTVVAVISIPIGIAHAQGAAQGRHAPAQTVHVTRAVAPKAAVNEATDPAEPADTTTEPAETGTDTGHSDEVAGNTAESTVDHQFDGQE
jgi:hypothetical protein